MPRAKQTPAKSRVKKVSAPRRQFAKPVKRRSVSAPTKVVTSARGTERSHDFESLIGAIRGVDAELTAQAFRAVNVSLTLRNWMIGLCVVEYEQRGSDRAEYGERLLKHLATRLQKARVSRSEERELRRYREFYLAYPGIRDSVSPELALRFPRLADRPRVASKRDSVSPESSVPGAALLAALSFTHFRQLLECEDPNARRFYEAECIRGTWSVRELQRQMESLLYERTALSTAGLDNEIFVSKYLLELPQKEAMQRFVEAQLAALADVDSVPPEEPSR